MPRPHYFCHISLMLLSTAALAAQVEAVAPQSSTSASKDAIAAPESREA
jgi:hypothetical protein